MKPTVSEVEEALGVKSEDWDCVDPEELIDTIYRLSSKTDDAISKQTNIHPLQYPKLPGKRRT